MCETQLNVTTGEGEEATPQKWLLPPDMAQMATMVSR